MRIHRLELDDHLVLDISYHYTPYEPQTLEYPGDEENWEIEKVEIS